MRIHLDVTKSNNGQIVQRNRTNSHWHVFMLSTQMNEFCLLHVCQPPLLMHVHLGEETYSHRDPDGFGLPTSSQNQTHFEAESNYQASNGQCLLGNGVGSETSNPVDPQIFAVAGDSHRQEVSQFQCLSMRNCSRSTFSIEMFFLVSTEQLGRRDRHRIQPPRKSSTTYALM